MQVKLLRVIQEKTIRPVGETKEISVDIRVLSATHKHLADLVTDGLFREDLYYRINVIELRVPPLRERDDDVILLANHVLRKLARRLDISTPVLSDNAADALRSYSFPGNVRELENVLERALTMCSGDEIGADDLQIREQKTPGNIAAGANNGGDGLGDQLESMERDAIINALEQTRHNKTAAAKLLGISFRALRYRIKKLGIE
jgi:two-component system response regulator PilR (NtrC family)